MHPQDGSGPVVLSFGHGSGQVAAAGSPSRPSTGPDRESGDLPVRSTIARALVLGGARCVWDDGARALELGDFDVTLAVNDIGGVWPGRVDYLGGGHPEVTLAAIHRRRALGFNDDFDTFGVSLPPGDPARPGRQHHKAIAWIPGGRGLGSSSMAAVALALRKGAARIVLAGVPLEPDQAHFHDPRRWEDAHNFRPAWTAAVPVFAGRVRSMSGWTRTLLSEPTARWLAGEQ